MLGSRDLAGCHRVLLLKQQIDFRLDAFYIEAPLRATNRKSAMEPRI
jgi:hypothetical protein